MLDPKLISRLPRFTDISPPALEWLCSHASVDTVVRGQSIFLEGDECNDLHMVLTGEVKIFKILESGREIILGIFRSGDAIGEVAVLDGEAYPANASAQETSTILRLSRADYLKLLERYPEVARSIIRDLTLRMRALRVRVETLSESGVQSRIAQLFLAFSRQLGRPEGNTLVVPLKLTRAEIASMVGARMETVIRIMSGWQKGKIVTRHAEGFLVENPAELERMIADEG